MIRPPVSCEAQPIPLWSRSFSDTVFRTLLILTVVTTLSSGDLRVRKPRGDAHVGSAPAGRTVGGRQEVGLPRTLIEPPASTANLSPAGRRITSARVARASPVLAGPA